MVAEYQAQLFTLEIDENTIVPSNEIDETPEII